jgi:hypothetical protein
MVISAILIVAVALFAAIAGVPFEWAATGLLAGEIGAGSVVLLRIINEEASYRKRNRRTAVSISQPASIQTAWRMIELVPRDEITTPSVTMLQEPQECEWNQLPRYTLS